MDVGIMGAASPDKEEEASPLVLDYSKLKGADFAKLQARGFAGPVVLDFSYLDDALDEVVEEIEERKPRPGDKAAADLPGLAVDKDGKVMELVHQEYIRPLLKSPPHDRFRSDCTMEPLRRTGLLDEEELEILARPCRASKLRRDIQKDIIQQYLDKGYAYVELPVSSERYPATDEGLPPLP